MTTRESFFLHFLSKIMLNSSSFYEFLDGFGDSRTLTLPKVGKNQKNMIWGEGFLKHLLKSLKLHFGAAGTIDDAKNQLFQFFFQKACLKEAHCRHLYAFFGPPHTFTLPKKSQKSRNVNFFRICQTPSKVFKKVL